MPRNRQFPTTAATLGAARRALAAAVAGLSLLSVPRPLLAAPTPADADSAPAAAARIAVPSTELRLLAGTGVAAEGAGSLLDHRLRLELAARGVPSSGLAEGAVLVRLVGDPAHALWARAGVLQQRFRYTCWDRGGVDIVDNATSLDGGLSYRRRWESGALLVAEAGVETLSRVGLYCNDSVLPSSSTGVRASLAGQLPITSRLGFYGRFGFRSAAHLKEIGLLPELFLGLAFEL